VSYFLWKFEVEFGLYGLCHLAQHLSGPGRAAPQTPVFAPVGLDFFYGDSGLSMLFCNIFMDFEFIEKVDSLKEISIVFYSSPLIWTKTVLRLAIHPHTR